MTTDSSHATTEQRTAMVRRLFTHWQLSSAEQADLLGLGSMSRDEVSRLLEGDAACAGPEVEVRVGHL